jgi:hypothetical protein
MLINYFNGSIVLVNIIIHLKSLIMTYFKLTLALLAVTTSMSNAILGPDMKSIEQRQEYINISCINVDVSRSRLQMP